MKPNIAKQQRGLEEVGGALLDAGEDDQRDDVDDHGVDREHAVHERGAAQQPPQVEQQRERGGGEAELQGVFDHGKISWRRSS
jgi:hypothetical protein